MNFDNLNALLQRARKQSEQRAARREANMASIWDLCCTGDDWTLRRHAEDEPLGLARITHNDKHACTVLVSSREECSVMFEHGDRVRFCEGRVPGRRLYGVGIVHTMSDTIGGWALHVHKIPPESLIQEAADDAEYGPSRVEALVQQAVALGAVEETNQEQVRRTWGIDIRSAPIMLRRGASFDGEVVGHVDIRHPDIRTTPEDLYLCMPEERCEITCCLPLSYYRDVQVGDLVVFREGQEESYRIRTGHIIDRRFAVTGVVRVRLVIEMDPSVGLPARPVPTTGVEIQGNGEALQAHVDHAIQSVCAAMAVPRELLAGGESHSNARVMVEVAQRADQEMIDQFRTQLQNTTPFNASDEEQEQSTGRNIIEEFERAQRDPNYIPVLNSAEDARRLAELHHRPRRVVSALSPETEEGIRRMEEWIMNTAELPRPSMNTPHTVRENSFLQMSDTPESYFPNTPRATMPLLGTVSMLPMGSFQLSMHTDVEVELGSTIQIMHTGEIFTVHNASVGTAIPRELILTLDRPVPHTVDLGDLVLVHSNDSTQAQAIPLNEWTAMGTYDRLGYDRMVMANGYTPREGEELLFMETEGGAQHHACTFMGSHTLSVDANNVVIIENPVLSQEPPEPTLGQRWIVGVRLDAHPLSVNRALSPRPGFFQSPRLSRTQDVHIPDETLLRLEEMAQQRAEEPLLVQRTRDADGVERTYRNGQLSTPNTPGERVETPPGVFNFRKKTERR